uniref:Uncharacterized protein n=1 Tax=Trichobilharzia regenti TaxID=157069 RepID=A0AA85KIR1_TRIRE|nr:unnamed protein product [Trichobilharzia regenti]
MKIKTRQAHKQIQRMAHLSILCIVMVCVLLPHLVEMKTEKKSWKLPLHIDGDGSWGIKHSGLTIGAKDKGIVIIKSGYCVTEFDLSKPTAEELSAKKGSRQVTTVCDFPDLKKSGKKIGAKKDSKKQ